MSNELIKTAEPSTIAAFMQPRHRQAERDEIARLTKEWEKKNGKSVVTELGSRYTLKELGVL